MGATSPEPAPQSHAERFFPYSSPEPWTWIPGTWILPGTIFVTAEGRFYRFVERTDEGWKTEEVQSSTVGNPARIAEITAIQLRYQRALSAHGELDQKMRDGEDTPEARAFLSARDEELHHLRDQLILFCNGRGLEARAAAKDPDRWKWALAVVLAVVFVMALIYCIRTLFVSVPAQAGKMIAGAVFFLSGAVLFIIGARELAKRKNRLVTGNLVGCYTLIMLGVFVAAFAVMCISVLLMYMGAYTI
jgi:cation transport ATPase